MNEAEVKFFVHSGYVKEGGTVTFKVCDHSEYKTIKRRIYFNKYDGLYIMYKGRKYFESEFVYYNEQIQTNNINNS